MFYVSGRLREAHLYVFYVFGRLRGVFYVSWRLCEAHLYVFYVSGRLLGVQIPTILRARVGPLERTSRVRGEGRWGGEGGEGAEQLDLS